MAEVDARCVFNRSVICVSMECSGYGGTYMSWKPLKLQTDVPFGSTLGCCVLSWPNYCCACDLRVLELKSFVSGR